MSDRGLYFELKGAELIKHYSELAEKRNAEAAGLGKSLIKSSSGEARIEELKRDAKRYAFYAAHTQEGATYRLNEHDLNAIEMFGERGYV